MNCYCINKKLKQALALTILLLGVVLWGCCGDSFPIQPFCLFRKLTGIPCSGCGGVRAMRHLLSGDFVNAININPLSVVLCIIIPILNIALWIDYYKNTNQVRDILCRKWSLLSTLIVLIIIVLNWIWNIQKGL